MLRLTLTFLHGYIKKTAPVLPLLLPGSIQGLLVLCAILQIVLMKYCINCVFSLYF